MNHVELIDFEKKIKSVTIYRATRTCFYSLTRTAVTVGKCQRTRAAVHVFSHCRKLPSLSAFVTGL